MSVDICKQPWVVQCTKAKINGKHIVMSRGKWEEVVIVWEMRGRSHKEVCLKWPSDCSGCMACLITLSHHILFVFFEVMVEADVMRPHPPLVREMNLLFIGSVVGNGAVIDLKASGGLMESPG